MPTTSGSPPKPERPTLGRVLVTIFLGGPLAICFIALSLVLLLTLAFERPLPFYTVGYYLLLLLLSGTGMLVATGYLRQWLYLLPFLLYAGSVGGFQWLLEWLLPSGKFPFWFSFVIAVLPALLAAQGIRRYYTRKDQKGV